MNVRIDVAAVAGAQAWLTRVRRDPLRKLAAVAAAAMAVGAVALVAAGCGGGGSPSSAAAGGNSSSPSSSSSSSGGKLVKFSQCMRENGLADFPDPVNGRLSLTVSKGSDLDPSSPSFRSALQACKSLEPAGFAGSGGSQNTKQQSQLVKFSQCMRKHGVKNFPDPQSNGAMLIQGGINPNTPTFQNALTACRSLLPAGAVGG